MSDDVALLERGGPRREGAVDGHLPDADVVAAARHHLRDHLAHERRRTVGHQRQMDHAARRRVRNTHLVQVRQRVVDDLEVPAHDVAALVAVGLLDGVLDARDRLLARQHAGDGEEAGLQDGVDPVAQPRLAGDPGRVDHEEAQLLGR